MQSTEPTHIIIIWLSLTSKGGCGFSLLLCGGDLYWHCCLGVREQRSSYQLAGMKVSALYLVFSESSLMRVFGCLVTVLWKWKSRLSTCSLLVGVALQITSPNVWVEYSIYCLEVFCFDRLPFSWSLSRQSRFLSVLVSISGLQAHSAPRVGYTYKSERKRYSPPYHSLYCKISRWFAFFLPFSLIFVLYIMFRIFSCN